MRRRSARGPGVTTTTSRPSTRGAGASLSPFFHRLERRRERRLLREAARAPAAPGPPSAPGRARWRRRPTLVEAGGLIILLARRSAILLVDLGLRSLLPPRPPQGGRGMLWAARAARGWRQVGARRARARPEGGEPLPGENVDKKRGPRESRWPPRKTTS